MPPSSVLAAPLTGIVAEKVSLRRTWSLVPVQMSRRGERSALAILRCSAAEMPCSQRAGRGPAGGGPAVTALARPSQPTQIPQQRGGIDTGADMRGRGPSDGVAAYDLRVA